MNHEVLQVLSTFWSNVPYDTGFSDAIQSCGAREMTTRDGARAALAFLNGYAQACRLANEYMSRHWQVATLVAISAGCQLSMLDAGDNADTFRSAVRTQETEFSRVLALGAGVDIDANAVRS